MISEVLTGITLADYNSTDIPCSINDIFYANTDVNFISTLTFVNNKLGTSINSGNIANYKLYVRFCSSIDPLTVIAEQDITLSSNNIQNSSIVVHLNEITNLVTNDFLLETMNEDEIYSLYKEFKIIFRLYEISSGIGNKTQIANNDFVQSLYYSLNTAFSGPYNVVQENIDLLNKNDFTIEKINEVSENIPHFNGRESIRAFYPDNINSKTPIICIIHGVGQYTEQFDSLMNSLASYGYFCFSLYASTEIFIPAISLLEILDHFKLNEGLISRGKFANKINFNKIILCGKSRGVYSTILSYQFLSRKNSEYSTINDLSLNVSDIKAIINLAGVPYTNIGDDGLVVFGSGSTLDYNPDENNLNYFKYDINCPTISILGFNDVETLSTYYIDIFNTYGICYSNKLNYIDKYNLFQFEDHNGLDDTIATNRGQLSLDLNLPGVYEATNYDKVPFNNNTILLQYQISSIIQFLAINCFSSDKLKKLRFISLDKIKQKTLLEEFKRNNLSLNQIHPKYDDILYQIDNYFGITMSLAGITGFTFSSPLGFSYGYPIDTFQITSGNTLFNKISTDLYSNIWNARNWSSNLNYTDTFNGIIGNTYRSLFVPIESNISFGYTFNSVLGLTKNNYIGLKACHRYGMTAGTSNDKNSNFYMTIYDTNGNSSTISSKNYSDGFYKQINIYDENYTQAFFSNFPTVSNTVFFRAGDFYLKNNSLDLTNINQILLQFGPDYGSTYCHIAFDSFIVYKDL